MADEVEKHAVEEDMKVKSIVSQGWKLQDNKTSCICEWGGVHKMMQKMKDMQRASRLLQPVTLGAVHGQGKYMAEVVAKSSLAFKWLKKYKSNTEEHYQVLQYCMDKSMTADRLVRWGKQMDRKCVPCMLLRGVSLRQTKEHLWSGACIATNEILKQWIQ